jgi:hypothetical protein
MSMPRARRFVLVLSVVMVMGFGAASRAQEQSRPFRATLEGFANPMPTSDPCILVNDEHGTGHAQHLGRITWESQETVNLCSNPEGADINGQIRITAANGDVLVADYEALGHLDFSANTVSASGTYVVSGGTGRFADASGGGAISAAGSLLPPFELVAGMIGDISY